MNTSAESESKLYNYSHFIEKCIVPKNRYAFSEESETMAAQLLEAIFVLNVGVGGFHQANTGETPQSTTCF